MNRREHFHNAVFSQLQTIAGLNVLHTYVENRNPERPFAVVSIDPSNAQPRYYENGNYAGKRGECMVSIRVSVRAESLDVDGAGLLRQAYNALLHDIETALDGMTIPDAQFGSMRIRNAVCSVITEAPLFDDAEQEGDGIVFARIDYEQDYRE